MQGANTINLAWDHARRLVDVLTAHGATADTIADTNELEWLLAASIADIPKDAATSAAVRRIVVTKFRDAQVQPDPFAGIGF